MGLYLGAQPIGGGGGGATLTVAATVTASATLAAGKHTPVDATSGAKTMTLPTTAAAGVLISVEKTDASTNAVTVTGTLRGSTSSIPLTSQYEARTFLSEGSGSWRPVSDHRTAASLSATYARQGAQGRTDLSLGSAATQDTTAFDAAGAAAAVAAGIPTAVTNALPANGPATTVSVAQIYKNSVDAFSFPPRIRPPESNRRRVVVRNDAATDVQIAYNTGTFSQFNSPAGGAYTVTIPPGSEFVDSGNTGVMWARPATSGNQVLVTVTTEIGV